MDKRLVNLFWGVGLIAAGGLALAQTLGYIETLGPAIWVAVFAGLSVISFVTYFSRGVQNWGWLFPAGVCGALALVIGMAALGIQTAAVASPIFIGIGLPFCVVYFLDRARNWWALIPAGIMAFFTFTMLVVDNLGGEWIGAGLFFFIALAFLIVYLTNRSRLWAALVAYVMLVLGFMPVIALTPRPELAGILFLFAAGLPFLVVYLSSRERWWALIPAGFLLTSGIVTAIVLLPGRPGPEFDNRLPNALALAGFAVTFAILWLRHHQSWAMIATAIAAVMAAGALVGAQWPAYGALVVIFLGVYLLFRALRLQPA